MFFTGMDDLHHAGKVPAAFISAHRLARRRSPFPVKRWVMDSGAYRTIELHGGFPEGPEAHAALIRRFAANGRLLAAVTQDFMCDPGSLARTGLSVAEHQRLTIERYDALLACDPGGIPIMPVLQGRAPEDYARHVRMYGDRLAPRAWVGVGSLVGRSTSPATIAAILRAILRERPDLRLHGFGLKLTVLGDGAVRDLLFSADSMAWSFHARKNGRNAHDPAEARRFARRVHTMPVQLHLPGTMA